MASVSLVIAALMLGAAATPVPTAQTPRSGVLVARRFRVHLTADAVHHARLAGVDVRTVVDRALVRINTLLPGSPTTVFVSYLLPYHILTAGPGVNAMLIFQTGTAGETAYRTGVVHVAFGPTARVRPVTSIRFWLPRTLAHEVDHSVRILDGPGIGFTVMEQVVSEGISSNVDTAACPGQPVRWTHSLTAAGRCIWWRKIQPYLTDEGLYQQWMFGYFGVPRWTGFALGYYLVRAYHLRHPRQSWDAITKLAAAAILAGSRYQPCS